MQEKIKIALVVSHPIQHFCPQYVSFATNPNVDFKVFFGSMLGFKKYVDINFGEEISWGNLHLDKFQHVFLNGDKVLLSDKNLYAETLEKELDNFSPGLLIVYGYFQKLQKQAYHWAIKNNVQIAYISDSERRHKKNLLKEVIKYFFISGYFKKITYFLSVGNANEDFYKYYGVPVKKIIRMHFPIDIIQYQSAYENRYLLGSQLRKKYNIRQDEIVLTVVGKLAAWKNQDHIIKAMALLEKRKIFCHLFIVGSGQMMNQWKKTSIALSSGKVYFPGFVDIADLPAYYAATDIYVHPASLEPHSIAISEAIYMACPVVVSNRSGSFGEQDDVQEAKNGIIYPFGDIAALANSIASLINDDKRRKNFSDHSHEIAVKYQNISHYDVLNKLVINFKNKID